LDTWDEDEVVETEVLSEDPTPLGPLVTDVDLGVWGEVSLALDAVDVLDDNAKGGELISLGLPGPVPGDVVTGHATLGTASAGATFTELGSHGESVGTRSIALHADG